MNGLICITVLALVGAGLHQAHKWGYDKGFRDGYEDGEDEGYRCGREELEQDYKKKYRAEIAKIKKKSEADSRRSFEEGRESVLQDIPKWDIVYPSMWPEDGWHFEGKKLFFNGYGIDLNELLEKLPKK